MYRSKVAPFAHAVLFCSLLCNTGHSHQVAMTFKWRPPIGTHFPTLLILLAYGRHSLIVNCCCRAAGGIPPPPVGGLNNHYTAVLWVCSAGNWRVRAPVYVIVGLSTVRPLPIAFMTYKQKYYIIFRFKMKCNNVAQETFNIIISEGFYYIIIPFNNHKCIRGDMLYYVMPRPYYCTLGWGLKTAMLVPPPPANRLLYEFELQY
jgi:hypothetical protein